MTLIKQVFVPVVLVVLISCSGLRYSTSAYNDDVAIKQKAITLIQKSSEAYSSHAAEIDNLKAEVLRAYEYEKSRKGNNSSVAMWSEVINAKGNLFDYFNTWKSGNQMSPAMATESAAQIEKLLNAIVELESNKKK